MNTFRRAATAATSHSRTALALLGSVTLLTFGTTFPQIFHLTVGIGT
ncbi:hypothetical protein [Streptomyces sp. NPDC059247]